MNRAYLNTNFAPGEVDRQFRELEEARDWREDARRERGSWETPPEPRVEPCSVYLERWLDGFAWRCADCGLIGRGFDTEAEALDDAGQHGTVVCGWA